MVGVCELFFFYENVEVGISLCQAWGSTNRRPAHWSRNNLSQQQKILLSAKIVPLFLLNFMEPYRFYNRVSFQSHFFRCKFLLKILYRNFVISFETTHICIANIPIRKTCFNDNNNNSAQLNIVPH